MASFNKVILVGNLVRDPELRRTNSGKAVANFTLAMNESWGKGDDRQEKTVFIDCKCWEKQAENLAEHKRKGDPLLIDGQLQVEKWEDKESGKNRSKVVVLARFITYLSRGDGGGTTKPKTQSAAEPDAEPDFDLSVDDTPF